MPLFIRPIERWWSSRNRRLHFFDQRAPRTLELVGVTDGVVGFASVIVRVTHAIFRQVGVVDYANVMPKEGAAII